MDKNIMATFGQGYVQTQNISENGAIKYKLSIGASNSNSNPKTSYLLLNDSPLGNQSFERGINVRLLDTSNNQIIDSKIFDLINAGGASTAFLNFMDGLGPNIVAILISDTEIKTEEKIDDWFYNAGSEAWPKKTLIDKFPQTSYACVYLSNEKSIVQEQCIINDGVLVEDSRAKLEFVYDTIDDIGVTGFSRKLIYDPNEYSADSGYEFKRYPSDDAITKLSGFGSTNSAKVMLIADLYASKELISNGLVCRGSLRWFNDKSFLGASNIETPSNSGDSYVHFERLIDVPADATGYTFIVSRYPNTNVGGIVKVKNVTLGRVSRADSPIKDKSSFGVNGIRTVTANDNGETDYILELPDAKTDQSGTIYSSNFKETEKVIS